MSISASSFELLKVCLMKTSRWGEVWSIPDGAIPDRGIEPTVLYDPCQTGLILFPQALIFGGVISGIESTLSSHPSQIRSHIRNGEPSGGDIFMDQGHESGDLEDRDFRIEILFSEPDEIIFMEDAVL